MHGFDLTPDIEQSIRHRCPDKLQTITPDRHSEKRDMRKWYPDCSPISQDY